jgi:5-methylcytosine-specific restriction endonuclease McrA
MPFKRVRNIYLLCVLTVGAQKLAAALRYHYAHPEKAKAKRSAYRKKNLEREKQYAMEYSRALASRKPEHIAVPDEKFCPGCGVRKLSDEFGKRATAPSGLRSRCIKCERVASYERFLNDRDRRLAQSRLDYEVNPEPRLASTARWLSKNKEKRRASEAAYKSKNAERLRKYRQERYQNNKIELNAKSKAWRRRNPEKVREFSHARRARLAGQGGRYTKEDLERIGRAQRGKCAICRRSLGEQFHRDHIMPISRGGSNAASNIQLTCDPCNRAKHAKDPIIFMRERGFLL